MGNAEVPMHRIIEIAMERIPVLPHSMNCLFRVLKDPMANFDDLSAIVNQDPTLATQTLHLCNSAYYSFPVEVTSVSHAVTLIGMKTVAGLAMAAYFQGLLEPKGVSGSVWLRGTKDHVLATAQLAEFLVREMPVKESPGTAFTGGLLHDIGKLVLSRMPSEIATEVRNHMDEEGLSLLDAEQIVLGTDHPEVGYRLAECWKVPEVIADVIRYHHMPMQSQYLLTLIVHAANTLIHQLNAKGPGVIEVSHIDPNVLYELYLTEDDVLTLVNNWIVKEFLFFERRIQPS
ncbi:MAG: HDOD domain-containing protein [Deltaproteobacteria bacterium]|nr:HDOD domain-containing protein [Deltaproteobacteria bacterium]